MSAAFLDEALEGLLRLRLIDDGGLEELLRYPHPVSSFSARIRVAFAVGLITADERDDLEVIRDLRNEFAHLHTSVSFGDGHVIDACRKLNVLGALAPGLIEKDARRCFVIAVTTIASSWFERIWERRVTRLAAIEQRLDLTRLAKALYLASDPWETTKKSAGG